MSEGERQAEGKQRMEEKDTRDKMVCSVNEESLISEKGRAGWKERKRKGRKGREANANAINHISSQHRKATLSCYRDTAHPGALTGLNSAPSAAPALL